jgi:hypothetical protein
VWAGIVETSALAICAALSSRDAAAFLLSSQTARKAVEMWKTELSANCGFSFLESLAVRPVAL